MENFFIGVTLWYQVLFNTRGNSTLWEVLNRGQSEMVLGEQAVEHFYKLNFG